MKKLFNLRFIGAAFVLLLGSMLSSCTTADGYTHYPLGIGANCGAAGIVGAPAFIGGAGGAPCFNGGVPAFQNQDWGYGQGNRLGYQRQPLQFAGNDAYGNQLYSGRSFSGHPYLTSNGYVNPPPIQSQNPYGQLRYVYFNSPDRRSDPGPNGQPPIW